MKVNRLIIRNELGKESLNIILLRQDTFQYSLNKRDIILTYIIYSERKIKIYGIKED